MGTANLYVFLEMFSSLLASKAPHGPPSAFPTILPLIQPHSCLEVGAHQAFVSSCYLPSDSIQASHWFLLHLQLLSLSYLCPGPYVGIQ